MNEKKEEKDRYEETYWEMVGRNPDGTMKKTEPEEPKSTEIASQIAVIEERLVKNLGGRPKGSKDSYHRRRRSKVTTEVSDGSEETKRDHSGSVDPSGSEGGDNRPD